MDEQQALYVGEVLAVSSKGDVAWIIPFSLQGGSVEPCDASEFPNNGRVIWFEASSAKAHHWYSFRAVPSAPHLAANDPRLCRFKAEDCRELAEIIDLRGLGGEPAARAALTGPGIHLQGARQSKIYIKVSDDDVIGPVDLVEEMGLWRVTAACAEKPLVVWETQDSLLQLRDGRLLALPYQETVRRTGMVDWADDPVILERTLRAARRAKWSVSPPQDHLLESLEEALGDLVHDKDQSLPRYRLERLRTILQELGARRELRDQVVTAVLGSSAVVTELEDIRRSTAKKALADVSDDLDTAGKLLRKLNDDRLKVEAELERLRPPFEEALKGRVEAILESPGHFLAEVTLLRAALGLRSTEAPSSPPAPPAARVESRPATMKECRAALGAAYRRAQVPVGAARLLDVSLVAGRIPLVTGDYAFEALELYAAHVAGAQMIWVPVSPATVDLVDLMAAGTSQPVPLSARGGLGAALAATADTEQMTLIVLEGLNLAPIDAYLMPLLRLRASAQRPTGKPLQWGGRIGQGWGEVSWPPNALLAGTVADGPASLPIPASLWREATLVDTSFDQGEAATHEPQEPEMPTPLHLSLAAWEGARESARRVNLGSAAALASTIRQEIKTPISTLSEMLHSFGASVEWGSTQQNALRDMVLACLVPTCAAEGDRLKGLLKLHSLLDETVERALDTIRRLSQTNR